MMPTEEKTVTLHDPWPSRVRGGWPTITFEDLPPTPELEPGDVVTFRTEQYEPLGLGIVDPPAQCWRCMPAEPDEAFDERFLVSRVRKALAIREQAGLVNDEAAYRLINGEGDGLSGFAVDVYAKHAVVYSMSESLDRHAPLLATAVSKVLHPASVISKVRPLGEAPTGKIPFRVEHGDEPPRSIQAREDDLVFEVHLTGGLNTGLFLDMRDVRRALRPLLQGKRILNTFSYTGAFTILGGLAGAKSVTSVDFASGVLDWTRTNLRLNEMNPDEPRFRFEREDVFDFLKGASRKEKLYDVVILDPPARTVVPGRRWFAKTDYGRLVMHGLKVAAPGCLLVACGSCHSSGPEKMESQIRSAARDAGRRLRVLGSFGLPLDHPTQMIHPQARYLKAYFLLVD